MLGGPSVLKHTPRSALDWVTLIRGGIPAAAVDSLTKLLSLTQAEFSAVLGIPERTLARRKKEGVLNAEESAKLVRLARVVRRAMEVFGGLETAVDWLKHANRSLGGQSPLSLMDTDIGAEGVMDTLGRIEHGVFA
jgi:putative toxin-antitoxin system antitoxin component (TIGR02293 family)